ncbi:hypothetical protein [Paraburkholderia monticola]|nr:hypothetical protein [Paraburkholderia monticola]
MDVSLKRLNECMGGKPRPAEADEDTAITDADELRLFEALAENPLTASRLAKKTGLSLRRVNPWLATQIARGHLEYDAASRRYWMRQEQARAIAETPSRAFMNEAFAVWRSGGLVAR